LVPAVQRAIGDARDRAERASQDAQIARLNRVLRMLKGVNEVLMRCRDRGELLAETCRVAVSLGGYAMAIAATRQAGGASVKAVASSGIDAAMTDSLRQHLEESAARESSVINTVLRTGKAFIRNEHRDEDGTGWFDSLMVHTGLRACVVLPLFVDGEPSAVLLLTAREPGLLGDEELGMLRDLADSLSFGLQSVHRDTRARFLSHFHPQTGLARRALFCDRVRALVAQAATDMPGHAIAIVDIRRLGAINDSFGRHTGDLLLRRVAEAMKRQLHEQERLAHFSGGTFAMAFNRRDMQGGDWQTFVREQVLQVFAQPFEVEEHRIPLTVRIGCALHPEDSDDPTALVQHAETALQVARAGSESMLRVDPRARLQNVGTLAMEHRLRLALERNEFELHYQPKVNVITRRIQGAAALLRWRSPEDGLVSPAGFLPV